MRIFYLLLLLLLLLFIIITILYHLLYYYYIYIYIYIYIWVNDKTRRRSFLVPALAVFFTLLVVASFLPFGTPVRSQTFLLNPSDFLHSLPTLNIWHKVVKSRQLACKITLTTKLNLSKFKKKIRFLLKIVLSKNF